MKLRTITLAFVAALSFSSSKASASFDALPYDIQVTVLSHADPTIPNLNFYALVGKKWREAAASDKLWAMACKVYFPFDVDFYKANSATAKAISEGEHKAPKELDWNIANHYPTFKLWVLWREAIAKELRVPYQTLKQHGDLSLFRKCLVSLEFLGKINTISIYLSNRVTQLSLSSTKTPAQIKADITQEFDSLIALGSKHAQEQKTLHQQNGVIQ